MALNDARLAQLAQEYSELKARSARLEKRAKDRSSKVIKEMERRGTRAIEHAVGRVLVRINKTQNEPIVYDEERLIAKLRRMRKFASGDVPLPVKEVLDVEALAALVQSGDISAGLLAKYSHVNPSSPYIRVTVHDA